MITRHGLAAILASALFASGAASSAQAAPAAPALQYGGFEVSQSLWACSLVVNGAVADAALTIDENLSTEGPIQPQTLPVKIAGNRAVNVAVICLPTSTVGVTRVLVVAASTNGATAEAYRNALRTDIAARAKGGQGQPFRGPDVGAAPRVLVMYGGPDPGRHQLLVTPAQASTALQNAGLAPGAATAGGEVAGHNGAVAVAANNCPFRCSLLGGVFAVVASSTDTATAGLYAIAIYKALLAR